MEHRWGGSRRVTEPYGSGKSNTSEKQLILEFMTRSIIVHEACAESTRGIDDSVREPLTRTLTVRR